LGIGGGGGGGGWGGRFLLIFFFRHVVGHGMNSIARERSNTGIHHITFRAASSLVSRLLLFSIFGLEASAPSRQLPCDVLVKLTIL
jgi:hypothetical protein